MEGISQAVLGLLAIGVIVGIAIVIGQIQGRVKTARTGSVLAQLTPVIGGIVSGGRLRGTYQGYSVEAWPDRRDPTPSSLSDGDPGPEVNVFNLKLADVPGRQYWYCRSRFRILAAPDFEFTGVLGLGQALEDRVAALTGLPATDAALEERLRAAGLLDELSQLGVRDSGYLPIVSFVPPPSQERLQLLAAIAPPAARDQMAHRSGELLCEIELGKGRVPTHEGFRVLLDSAVRIAHINAEANPSEDARHRS